MTVTPCSFINYKPPCFLLFTHYRYFAWIATPFSFFSGWNCPTFLCVNVTQISCLSPLFLWEVTHAWLLFLCVNVTQIYFCFDYKWTLDLVFFWIITDPFSYLEWTTAPHFLNENSTCPTYFLSFDNITISLFITNFHISIVIMLLNFLVFFFQFLRFI